MTRNDPRARGPATSASRRRLLEALAAAGVLGAGAPAAAGRPAATRSTQQEDVDPVFGFPVEQADEEPPVEPDHEVQLQLRQQETGDDQQLPRIFFQPTGLAVDPGDTVRFTFDAPLQTVTAYHPQHARRRRVPEGTPPFTSPVVPFDGYWLYTFEEEGVYDAFSHTNELAGTVVRVVAGGATDRPGADETDGDRLAPLGLGATVLNDESMRPETIADRERVSWEEARPSERDVRRAVSDALEAVTDGREGSDDAGSE